MKDNGYQAMITQHAWMFLSSYEKLRNKLQEKTIINMAHLGPRAFDEIGGEVVQTTSFVMSAVHRKEYKGTYARLVDISGEKEKHNLFLSGDNRYIVKQANFSKIPGSPFVYWITDRLYGHFSDDTPLRKEGRLTLGMRTGDNNRFLRLWYEISNTRACTYASNAEIAKNSMAKWFPYNKGGEFRKWYGNYQYFVNWENDGYEIKEHTRKVYPQLGDDLGWKITSEDKYFNDGLAWSRISSSNFGVRICRFAIFDTAAPMFFPVAEDKLLYYAGLMCSKVAGYILNVLNPTLTFQVGDVAKLPVVNKFASNDDIKKLVSNNTVMAKSDWDSFETSWDFAVNPLVAIGEGKSLADSYGAYKAETNSRFAQLKANEEELNRIFIDIYGLSDELTPEVADKDVTVASIFDTKDDIPESYKGNNYVLTKEDVIKNLISYAVGCLFGRYSLNKLGLIYAGGNWDSISKESFFEKDLAKGIPDNDNVIPITDEAYFEDDITGRFVTWLKEAFGADNLEDNLAFIADALSVKGDNSRDVIRNYFLSGFYADHMKKYQKRPIYWLYDSGKNNGFKALIYMHRYDADTTGRVRMDYLHRMEQIYGDEINRVTSDIQESTEAREKAKLQKRLAKLEKQVKECREYDESIGHLALERIDIDLDDGVKVNYEKVQTDRNGNIYKILGKI